MSVARQLNLFMQPHPGAVVPRAGPDVPWTSGIVTAPAQSDALPAAQVTILGPWEDYASWTLQQDTLLPCILAVESIVACLAFCDCAKVSLLLLAAPCLVSMSCL